MTKPLTQAEINGGWTSLANEIAFLEQVAAETDASLSVAGLSDGGRPIHRIEVGNSDGTTWVIMTSVHGSERASREGCLAWFRDLAYSTDPTIRDYLSAHRVVLFTPVNPDGVASGGYGTPQGDINKDYLTFATAPARVLVSHMRDLDPHLVVDCHEYGGTYVADLTYFGTGLLAVDAGLREASDEMCAVMHDAATAAGYSAGPYRSPGRVSGREMGAWFHAPSVLIESRIDLPMMTRVNLYSHALSALQEWHHAHATRLRKLKSASKLRARTNLPVPYPLQRGDVATGGRWPSIDLPETLTAYRVTGPLPTEFMDAYGITAEDDMVPLGQDMRVLIPLLFDQSSDNAVAEGERVLVDADPPLPSTDVIAQHVRVDGYLRQIIRSRMKGGQTVKP